MGVLRLFLALSVVSFHASGSTFLFMDARLAVQAFFLISGFYMALVLHEKYVPGTSNYLQFITSRFLRIFPAYYLVLLLTILLCIWADYAHGAAGGPLVIWKQSWSHLNWQTKCFLIFSHLSLLGQDAYLFFGLDSSGALYFAPHPSLNILWKYTFVPQAWSLSLEIYFYLLAPFLVRRPASVLAAMIMVCIFVPYILAFQFSWLEDPGAYRFFPSELALFLCGAGAYKVYRAVRQREAKITTWLGWGALGLAVGFVLSVSDNLSGGMLFSDNSNERTLCWSAIFVAMVPLALPFLFQVTQHLKVDRYLGELSYPMYLSHVFVILLVEQFQISDGRSKLAAIYLATILLSAILYWFLDRKVDNYRHRKFSAAN